MDPHGWCSAFYSSSEGQVCGRGKSDNSGRRGRYDSNPTVTIPYLEVKKDATECFFRSFEIATTTNIKNELETLMMHLSQNTRMILRQTIGKGAKVGHGLGRNLLGIQMVISSPSKHNHYGIGYQLGHQRRNSKRGSQKKDKMVRFNLVFPPLDWTFRSRGYINSNQSREVQSLVTPFQTLIINVITEDEEMDKTTCQLCIPAH